MAGEEDVAGGEQFDFVGVDFARFEQFGRFVDRLPEPGPDDAVGEVPRDAVRVNVDQADDEVGVGCRVSREMEPEDDTGSSLPCKRRVPSGRERVGWSEGACLSSWR